MGLERGPGLPRDAQRAELSGTKVARICIGKVSERGEGDPPENILRALLNCRVW